MPVLIVWDPEGLTVPPALAEKVTVTFVPVPDDPPDPPEEPELDVLLEG